MKRLLFIACLFALVLCLGPLGTAAGQPLSPDFQTKEAAKLIEKIKKNPKQDLVGFERLYREIIFKYPLAPQGEMSMWRLANLYQYGFKPPALDKELAILQLFMKRYPKSKGWPYVANRLALVYEMQKKPCQAADWRERLMARNKPKTAKARADLLLDAARSWDKCGKTAKAKGYYQKVLKMGDVIGDLNHCRAEIGLRKLK